MLGCDWAGLVDAQEVTFCPHGWKIDFLKITDFFNLTQSYIPILLLSPLKEDVTLHFNIFESPLYKDTLCQVWLKLAKWFLRRRFLKVVNVFSLCGKYLPLKNAGPLIEQIWIPFTQEYFVSCLVEIGPAVLEKIFKSCQYFSIFAIISP